MKHYALKLFVGSWICFLLALFVALYEFANKAVLRGLVACCLWQFFDHTLSNLIGNPLLHELPFLPTWAAMTCACVLLSAGREKVAE